MQLIELRAQLTLILDILDIVPYVELYSYEVLSYTSRTIINGHGVIQNQINHLLVMFIAGFLHLANIQDI